MSVGIPLYMLLNPGRAAEWFVSNNDDDDSWLSVVDEPERVARLQGVFRRVGLRHPDSVVVIETSGYGPTSFGMDSRFGSVVFLPRTIAALMDPATEVSIPGLYSGPVGAMTQAQRMHLLESEARPSLGRRPPPLLLTRHRGRCCPLQRSASSSWATRRRICCTATPLRRPR